VLAPLALAAATLYLLARASRAQLDQGPLPDSWLLTALDPSGAEEIRWAEQRWEAKRHVTWALLDGRLTLRQAAARFRDIDTDWPARPPLRRPPRYTEEEWACEQVIIFVHAELALRRRAPAQARTWVCRLEAELWGQRRPRGASPLATGQ
jgi:hypothetical protein